MIFSSPLFIFCFLPITFLLWRILVATKKDMFITSGLILASLVFYGSWNILYLPLIISSICFNFFVGRQIEKNCGNSRSWLVAGVTGNLGVLGFFKYTDFFLSNVNMLLDGNGPFLLHLTLPLGISFFTFQQIAFLVDCYRGEGKQYSFINYALFVTFFPQLIAGPIVHHKEMMPQFSLPETRTLNLGNVAQGVFIFAIGLCKKVVFADTFSQWVGAGFDSLGVLPMIDAWSAVLSYALQIYFDFSGYTDMAIGAALLFNIRLPINFNSPYKAISIADFWRRWHMTLGRWLRDYLYIPLGGSRCSSLVTMRNLCLVMLLGGLWHGAGWTFIFWGALHGIALAVHAAWQRSGISLHISIARAITFVFVLLAWIPFRATSMDAVLRVLQSMFSPASLSSSIPESLLWIAIGLAITMFLPNSMQLAGVLEGSKRLRLDLTNPLHATGTGLLLAIASTWMLVSTGSEFIYFNF